MKKAFILLLSVCALGVEAQAQSLPDYKNPDLAPEVRAQDLLGRLSLEQKVKLMLSDSPAIPEFGIPAYNWWNEALHGAARSGLATVFPQAIGMAASFDPDLLRQVMTIAGTEQRIKFIQARRKQDVKRYSGLTVWTPNINIFRDPRWGRGQETYGEDPWLTAVMGEAVVTGLQDMPDHKVYGGASAGTAWRPYDKIHACLKHFAVHSGPEYERHKFNAVDMSQRDMSETYLYAFERLVRRTDVHEVMCAYNAYEGKPCCGSDQLLTHILRNEWGYKGLVVSDCSAIRDFYGGSETHNIFPGDAAVSSANAVLSGTDVECGSSYNALPEAVRRGAIREADIDVSVLRLLTDRFRLGELDADSLVSWNQIPLSALACDDHAAVALKMARESMTLLKNSNQTLPLRAKTRVALVGPNANDSLTLWGNYYGTPRHTVTVREALTALLGAENIIYDKASEWVTDEVFQSRYDRCSTAQGRGMHATYWDNRDMTGEPVAEAQMASPFQLCTGGATVFAPGVPLSGFSARYVTTYHADIDERVTFDYLVCGEGELRVDGERLSSFRTNHGARRQSAAFEARAGQDYQIELDFRYIIDDAQLNFDLGVKRPSDLKQLAQRCADADVIVYVGGISPLLEGEEMKVPYDGFRGGDRTNIELPAIQRQTLRILKQLGKPIVYVNMSGSAIGFGPEVEACDAILQAWYGGQAGGQAVADVLTGAYNPAGRLPVTFYRSADDLPDFGDYHMAGHTYRYFQGSPLFAFGEGLSYSTFSYGKAKVKGNVRKGFVVIVPVTNTSSRDGEEVVQVYLRRDADVEGPARSLRAFQRVAIPAGQTVVVELPLDDVRTFDPTTMKLDVVKGKHTLFIGSSSREEHLQRLSFGI